MYNQYFKSILIHARRDKSKHILSVKQIIEVEGDLCILQLLFSKYAGYQNATYFMALLRLFS